MKQGKFGEQILVKGKVGTNLSLNGWKSTILGTNLSPRVAKIGGFGDKFVYLTYCRCIRRFAFAGNGRNAVFGGNWQKQHFFNPPFSVDIGNSKI
jgi:hypothetical protein